MPDPVGDMSSKVKDNVEAAALSTLKTIESLCERAEFHRCATVVNGLDLSVLRLLAERLPVKAIIARFPASLCIVEALFSKVFIANLNLDHLYPDRVLSQLIVWLSSSAADAGLAAVTAGYMCQTRNVLRVIAYRRPELCRRLWRRHKLLRRCVRDLGEHRLVTDAGGRFVHLHDALRSQLKTHLQQLRSAADRLAELGLVHEPVSLSGGPAPTGAGHQRLLQVTSSAVQERLFTNKSLLNVFEPLTAHERLSQLLELLESRVAADKSALLLYAEVRREADGSADGATTPLATTLARVADGHDALLTVVGESCDATLTQLWASRDGDDDAGNGEFIPTGTEATESYSDQVPLRRKTTDDIDISGGAGRERPCSDPPVIPHSLPAHAALNGGSDLVHFPSMPVVSLTATTATAETEEVAQLRGEVLGLRRELSRCRETIARMNARERALKERLSAQAQKQFEKGPTKFEDLSLGANRPTELIRSYGDLYSEARLDAFDALDALPQLADFEDLKGKLLFSVIVLAFRSVQHELHSVRRKVRQLLQMPAPGGSAEAAPGGAGAVPAGAEENEAAELEGKVATYLRRTVEDRDISRNLREVSQQMWTTLYDYPSLRECAGLQTYMEECVRLAWALTVQDPPLVLDYEPRVFSAAMHTRFHASDADSDDITAVLWPALREGEDGTVVHKAVVIT